MSEERRERRYRVSGEDSEGDLQIMETDDLERAEAMRAEFEEDLANVALDDRQPRLCGGIKEPYQP